MKYLLTDISNALIRLIMFLFQLNCNIIEWGGGPLGPEAMFFKPNGGAEFEIWAVSDDYNYDENEDDDEDKDDDDDDDAVIFFGRLKKEHIKFQNNFVIKF